MVIRITFKRLVLILLTFIVGLNVYLCETNYWFDRKLERMASPLLKEVMKVGYYRVGAEKDCPFEGAQLGLDFLDLMLKLVKKYPNLPITAIIYNDCPGGSLRVNGQKEIDEVFNNSKEIKCDIDKKFPAMLETYKRGSELWNINKNDRIYSFHKTSECTNYHIFKKFTKDYPEQIFSILTEKSLYIPKGIARIFKKNNYYYVIFDTNSTQPHYRDKPTERYFIFKKLTLEQLMRYDNGSYWKLIKDYNIKID